MSEKSPKLQPVLIYGGIYFTLQILVFVFLELGWLSTFNPKILFGGPIGFAAVLGTLILRNQKEDS